MSALIEINDLHFSYGKKEVISGLSLEVQEGDIMCFMGKNGCGKTTLIDCILGFHRTSSAIRISGQPVNLLSRSELARKISYVQQISSNDSMLEVFDYLALGRIVYKKIYEKLTKEDTEIIERVSRELGIETWMKKSVNQLSGGEKQLVMIARALIQDTPIIIMDEPTSALDFGNQSVFLGLVSALQKKGKTIVFTTHNPNHALALDSKICLMHQGVCIRYGKARSCLDEEILRKIYGDNIHFVCNDIMMACTFNV